VRIQPGTWPGGEISSWGIILVPRTEFLELFGAKALNVENSLTFLWRKRYIFSGFFDE